MERKSTLCSCWQGPGTRVDSCWQGPGTMVDLEQICDAVTETASRKVMGVEILARNVLTWEAECCYGQRFCVL